MIKPNFPGQSLNDCLEYIGLTNDNTPRIIKIYGQRKQEVEHAKLNTVHSQVFISSEKWCGGWACWNPVAIPSLCVFPRYLLQYLWLWYVFCEFTFRMKFVMLLPTSYASLDSQCNVLGRNRSCLNCLNASASSKTASNIRADWILIVGVGESITAYKQWQSINQWVWCWGSCGNCSL